MYTNQYFQYNQQAINKQYPFNNYQMYNHNQQPAYRTLPLNGTAAIFVCPTVPVQQPQASAPEKKASSIWMGNVQPYMTETFITGAFQLMGEYPMNVKLIRNKNSEEAAGYAYVDFYDSVSVMHRLNGKFIPGTNPPVKFKLNHTGSPGKNTSSERNFSVWIGKLDPSVDDYQLYKIFACRYQSIHTVKVILDSAGLSKGYGFINFGSEEEQKHCINNMDGFPGLGSRPIKVRQAKSKSKSHVASNDSQGYSQDYGQYFQTDYWHQYSIWNQPQSQKCMLKPTIETPVVKTIDNVTIVDHKKSTDVHALNKELVLQDYNLWDALESSKWLPLNSIEDI